MDMREDMRPLAVAVIKVLQNISESVVNTPLDQYLYICVGYCFIGICESYALFGLFFSSWIF